MKKFLRFSLKILVLLVALVLPVSILFIVTENIPNQYNNTYLAEINDKYNRLVNTKEKKIIFVGGSALAFGLRSDLLEEKVSGYKTINFGLYATLGTKFMMDLSKANINEGDIVVLSPEINEQTYSLYFNPAAVLEACDGLSNKYRYLSPNENLKLFYNYFNYSFNKIGYSVGKNAPDPIGIYRHDSFNEYGDIKVERENNIMLNGYDGSMKIVMDDTLLNDGFIKYVNDYNTFITKRKARLFFSFSPCNQKAVFSSKETRSLFEEKLSNALSCGLLMGIEESLIDYRFFYDTNFHLNSVGAEYYTTLLANSLNEKINNKEKEDIDIDPPVPEEDIPSSSDDTSVDDSSVEPEAYKGEPNNSCVDYFSYQLIGSAYQVIGIKEEYKKISEVIMPYSYEGKVIASIATNAFDGCRDLKTIYIGKSYKMFEEKCFNTCSSLERIYLYVMDGNTLLPPSKGFLDGTNSYIKIYIPEGSNYTTGYTWSNYSSFFEYFEV